MSAKKYLTTILLVSIFTSITPIFSQNDMVHDSELLASDEDNPQFLLRTEQNGKTKYVECALPNLYFHKATASTPEEEVSEEASEFTAKGAVDVQDEYYGYVFFLVQDGVIIASNGSGSFDDQPGGRYNLSRFSYPLSILPESFNGKDFNTVDNHPLFEKDPALYNLTIRLLGPKIAEPVLSTEPVDTKEENILGQVEIIDILEGN